LVVDTFALKTIDDDYDDAGEPHYVVVAAVLYFDRLSAFAQGSPKSFSWPLCPLPFVCFAPSASLTAMDGGCKSSLTEKAIGVTWFSRDDDDDAVIGESADAIIILLKKKGGCCCRCLCCHCWF
jgi:hypothetical protein